MTDLTTPQPGEADEPGRGEELPPPVGPPPAEVAAALGTAAKPLQAFASLLGREGVVRGLIGPREVGRLWERHLWNSLAPVELVPSGSSVLDLGSGAGLPGVVWAVARPDLRVELVEPLLRRVTWLDEVVAELALPNVTVTRARAEELRGDRAADVVTARAVAPLERLADWALPLLRPGGVLLALKGESAEEELRRARPALARLGADSASVLQSGAGGRLPATTVVRVVAGAAHQPTRGASRPRRRDTGRGADTRRRRGGGGSRGRGPA